MCVVGPSHPYFGCVSKEWVGCHGVRRTSSVSGCTNTRGRHRPSVPKGEVLGKEMDGLLARMCEMSPRVKQNLVPVVEF